jgi:hypothetical protein
MVALDASTSDTHTHTHTHTHTQTHIHTYTHTHTLRTHAQITSAAAATAMHKDTGLAHRLTNVVLALHAIGLDESCPCPRKPMLCST